MAAGHSTCCVGGDCGGSPLSCYCDANCHVFGDCCQDVPTDCISAGKALYLLSYLAGRSSPAPVLTGGRGTCLHRICTAVLCNTAV